MTSGTSDSRIGELVNVRDTSSQLLGLSSVVLLGMLINFQHANAVTPADALEQLRSSAQLTTTIRVVRRDLFSELVDFHQKLAAVQRELPADEARLLRENLWNLYD